MGLAQEKMHERLLKYEMEKKKREGKLEFQDSSPSPLRILDFSFPPPNPLFFFVLSFLFRKPREGGVLCGSGRLLDFNLLFVEDLVGGFFWGFDFLSVFLEQRSFGKVSFLIFFGSYSGFMAMALSMHKDSSKQLDSSKYVRYTPDQVEALERVYMEYPKPSSIRRQQLRMPDSFEYRAQAAKSLVPEHKSIDIDVCSGQGILLSPKVLRINP